MAVDWGDVPTWVGLGGAEDIVWQVVTEDLPHLVATLEPIVPFGPTE